MASPFRAFQSRNYSLYFTGQLLSLVGTWMQQVAMGWLVYRLTHSAAWIGFVSAASVLPAVAVAPFAGVLADRHNRWRILFITQALAALQAFALAGFCYAGVISVWHILPLALLAGAINGVDLPVRQSFMVELVADRGHLSSAIAMNSAMFNGARLIGPTLAGLLIARAGEGACFAINGASFLCVIVALGCMRLRPAVRSAGPATMVWADLRAGLAYVHGHKPIRSALLLVLFGSITGMSSAVLLPVYVHETLHRGSEVFGLLAAAPAAGALVGVALLAARTGVGHLIRMIGVASVLFPCGLAAFALVREPHWAALCLAVVGCGVMLAFASCQTLLQGLVDEDKRSRVTSLLALAPLAGTPLGSLLVSSLAAAAGVTVALLASAGGALLSACWFLRNRADIEAEIARAPARPHGF